MTARSMCGADCCIRCDRKEACGGCEKTHGHPFGGTCIAAECVRKGGQEALLHLKQTLIQEFNTLGIEGLQISDLNLLPGFYINLEYPLPNGQKARFLKDSDIYWGNQVEKPGSDRCYGLATDGSFLAEKGQLTGLFASPSGILCGSPEKSALFWQRLSKPQRVPQGGFSAAGTGHFP